MTSKLLIIVIASVIIISGAIVLLPSRHISYAPSPTIVTPTNNIDPPPTTTPKDSYSTTTQQIDIIPDDEPISSVGVTHIETPETVRGLYLTGNTFSSVSTMNDLLSKVKNSDINTLVIDVTSDGGPLFPIKNAITQARLALLHHKNLYLIARVVALNDGKGGWYDPMSQARRDTLFSISQRAVTLGFDEINFDYVRYPGPGEPKNDTPITDRINNITSLFKFMKEDISDVIGHPISLDIFGSTFIYQEANIGQNMEEAVRYFDYIMPMPYPSHWAEGTFGYQSPGKHPYEIVNTALKTGWAKVKNDPQRIAKLRSWIQDFNLESVFPIRYIDYTPEMIYQQIYACQDNGCEGWVLWNPRNEYRAKVITIPANPNPAPPPPSTATSSKELKTSTSSAETGTSTTAQ